MPRNERFESNHMRINRIARVKDKDGIVRDLDSHAIIVTDNSAYNEYMKRKKIMEESVSDKKRIERLENLVDELLKKFDEIKK